MQVTYSTDEKVSETRSFPLARKRPDPLATLGAPSRALPFRRWASDHDGTDTMVAADRKAI
jgi:hypothetical protein